MPFTARQVHDRVVPVAVCDYCSEEIQFTGDRIEGWGTGNAEWARDQETRERSSEVFLAHERCTRQLEEKHLGPNDIWETMELTHYLAKLLQSMNFAVDDLWSETQDHPLREVE